MRTRKDIINDLKKSELKKIITIFSLLICFWASAQSEALFNRATTAYNEGNYEQAAENYLKILENGQHSSELYFNLGNCYYKLNHIAPSIYYYEKALLLKPNDPEIKNNLAYAQNMTLDAIEPLPKTIFAKIYKSTVKALSFDQWAYLAIAFMFLFVISYIAFYFFRFSSRKRLAFVISIISLLLMLVGIIFAYLGYREFKKDNPAIIFSEETMVKSEPNKRSQAIFTLHEGAKVNVVDVLNDWKKIEIADGKTGWISSEDLKMLKDF
ncbi:SH3 domain-containing protein [Kriegella aquimaris]|uniref:SH3 domain-containing protein n=1 Tax=Kriegella aquimaris TaxID=192904 RepID=A0A1G9LR46_9FLAO|nr:tetratricopeptide repeat protein [Kriegella aquimaris]SDL64426.1 SH3 domain-containing protein [Kriegella aquimaris]